MSEHEAVEIDLPATRDEAAQESERANYRHRVTLRPDDRIVFVSTMYGDGMPERLHSGRDVFLGRIPDGCADTSGLRTLLESDDVQAELRAIVVGLALLLTLVSASERAQEAQPRKRWGPNT
jgi:hypothetical protein